MCGVVGVFNLDGAPVDRRVIDAMMTSLAHRGPDGQGAWIVGSVGLGHRRLAILDTSSNGSQPMQSKCGEWVVVFNGCIYNFRELRRELSQLGHTFISGADTEVIAEGLSAWGSGVFERFNGMFAVAAYNSRTHELLLSRDRFGIKPLYYWFTPEKLVFASEIKAIMQHPDFRPELNRHCLNEYFTFQNQFTFQTLFRGVTMLPPANTIRVDSTCTGVRHHSWWDYDFAAPDETMTFEDATAETRRLMEQAVERQLVSDVPVGSYLSGGMDSGSITAIASRHARRLTTFTCGFDLSAVTGVEANCDERQAAELMANHFKTEHYEQVINAGDLGWSLPRVVWHLEDLRVGMSYPNYYISRLASKFVKVCLQGTGGDEVFGGYPWRYYRVFKSLDQREFLDRYYDFWQRLVPDDEKAALFQSSVLADIDVAEPRRAFERVFHFNTRLRYDTPEHHIQNSLYFEIKTFLPGLLVVGDRLSMASGLEERYPFLDNDLVELGQRIPVRYKLSSLERMKRIDENELRDKQQIYFESAGGKTVLRQAMASYIPDAIVRRKKQGFSAPDESWYRGENAAYVKGLLLDRDNASSEFIRPDFVRRVISEHIEKRRNRRLLLWSLMCFEWWCRLFLRGEPLTVE
ncbi:MAG: asparagine synthase (glutamine-hydrolyzing) [Acidobacteriota bacterium]